MKKRLSNNKGFSLVELIIVVAIMAILIGILVPQYMKYVEKSRLSADNDSIDSVRKTMEIVASDPNVVLTGTKYTATLGSTGVSIVGSSSETDLDTEVKKLLDTANMKLKSKTYKSQSVTIELEFETDANGVSLPKITVNGMKGNS